MLEPGERVEALRATAPSEEAREEAGAAIDPAPSGPLGAPFFLLPGIVSEKIHVLEAEVERSRRPRLLDAPREGDGSPLEEGSLLQWRTLDGRAPRPATAARLRTPRPSSRSGGCAARLGLAPPAP